MSVAFLTPTLDRPYPQYVAAMEASVPALNAAGIEHAVCFEVGCPYISAARATLLRKAMDAGVDQYVFIDHDLSWDPEDLARLVQTPGEVVCGVYRFKQDKIEYMGAFETEDDGVPVLREDGCIAGARVPAGFLKITRQAVERFMKAYPDLVFGPSDKPSVDLFNHGAHGGVWWGEDYAFSRRWKDLGGDIWIIPDLNLTHHAPDEAFPGNLHQFLMRQPGGCLAEAA